MADSRRYARHVAGLLYSDTLEWADQIAEGPRPCKSPDPDAGPVTCWEFELTGRDGSRASVLVQPLPPVIPSFAS